MGGLRIIPFHEEHLGALARFSERTWRRPVSEAFLRWRYVDCPDLRGVLAVEGGEVIATSFAFGRAYQLGAERRRLLESIDWYTLPELTSTGVGIRVLRRMMKEPEPLISVGGTQTLIERMGFAPRGELDEYLLPLAGRRIAAKLHREHRVPEVAGRLIGRAATLAWYRPRRHRPPTGGEVLHVASFGPEVLELHAADTVGTRALPEPAWLDWLMSFPGTGTWLPLYFLVDGRLRGYTLGRVSRDDEGTQAELVDVFAPSPTPALYGWMVSETIRRLAGFEPGGVAATAGCPVLSEALRRSGMYLRTRTTVRLRSVEPLDLAGPLRLTRWQSDHALRPYPSRWPPEI